MSCCVACFSYNPSNLRSLSRDIATTNNLLLDRFRYVDKRNRHKKPLPFKLNEKP